MGRSKKTVPKPLSKGVAKVPMVMQLEALECGAASLAMILAYYGKWLPLEQVRTDCGVSRDGSNAKNILRAARGYGLTANGYRFEPEELKSWGKFPCIIHWNFNHFVVLNGFRGGKAVVNDPEKGSYSVSTDDFDRAFTGICLMFEPAEDFEPGGRRKSVLSFAGEKLAGAQTAVTFAVITTVITSLLGILYSAFSRVFLDRLLTGVNPGWAAPFLWALSAAAVIHIVLAFIQAIFSARIHAKMDAVGSSSFLWKVLRLPMDFFAQRMAGDIQQRIGSNASVAGTLVNILSPLAIHACMMAFYLAVMLRYSRMLTAVGVFSILVNLLMSRIIARQQIDLTRVRQRDAGKLSSVTVSGIGMIETIKASGAENGYFERWAGYQAGVNVQNVKSSRLNRRTGLIPPLVSTLTNTAVLILGVWLVMDGRFTIGMVMAFQGFLSSFTAPASRLIGAGRAIQEMRTDMERIEDVMSYPADPACGREKPDGDGGYSKLSGAVELKGVTFGYSRLAEPLIKDFNLTLRPGSRVALVGPSGCGKSTIAMLIAGLYQPWEGEISFDGKPMAEIDRSVFTGSLAVVDQEIILFEDTIANNIKMWDNSIEDFEMIMAARDARLHEDIMQREGGYSYRLLEGGRDLSGGQRQRLEIARVLAQDPTIIILDEATSALDAKTEHDVVKAIWDRGITCIVAAHRLSAIRDCDEIIVMDRGRVVERGSHEELYALGGFYTRLVAGD